jgi:macrolide-specific efflux system membrane fusion protein
MRLKVAALVLLLVVGLGAAAYALLGGSARGASTSQFLTAQVTRQDVVDEVAATGSVSATGTYHLAFGSDAQTETTSDSSSDSSSASSNGSSGSVAWKVSKVAVKVGDHVTKGQTLAEAGSQDLEVQIVSARRAVASAKIQLAVAQTALDDATTTAAIRQATINFYNAETQLADASTTQNQLETTRAHATLVAPEAGTVTAVNVVAGETAPSGDAMVVQSAGLEVTGDVVESDVSSVKVGQTATVTIDAVGATVSGSVTAVAPSATASQNGSVVTFAVTVALKDPPAAVRPGMSAQVSVTIAQVANALTVPTAALQGTTGSYAVRVLGADGQVETRPVTVGLITSSLAEVTDGVTEGETIVTGTTSERAAGSNAFGGGFGGGGGGVRVPVTVKGP